MTSARLDNASHPERDPGSPRGLHLALTRLELFLLRRRITAMDDARRDWPRRLVFLLLAAYVGSMTGMQVVAGLRPQWDLLNPLATVAAISGAVITPGANVVLIVVGLFSYLFVRTRVPMWTSTFLLIGYRVVGYWVVRGWSVTR